MQKIKETYAFIHKDIKIFVKIDYVNNKISLMEPFKPHESEFKIKEWKFSKRGVEYMNGWLDILEAMKFAIIDAKKKYEKDLAENSKFTEDAY